MVSTAEHRFIKLNLITIIATLVLILAGGIVRSTGSGMGCPDWPKCFDQYIPPTDISQLPEGYKEKYVAGRLAKNAKFAKLLDKMGKNDLAERIRHDESITVPEEFNVAKTWTEYVNRLTGALTGFLLLALTVLSFAYRKKASRIITLSFLNIIVVGFQAWLGSIVVSTNLLAWIVTVHMLLALVMLAILVYTYNYAKTLGREDVVVISRLVWLRVLIVVTILAGVLQVILGTEVRETIDVIAKAALSVRADWVDKVGSVFIFHRDMAILVAILNVMVYKVVMDKFGGRATELRVGNAVLLVLLIQIVTGVILANFALPPYAQALHILFSTVLFTLQYYLYLLVYNANSYRQH
ncbi:COX15/CtaA family protein [Pedobacter sp. MC2016-14]|uniref:COX15/CtaA family protein n=1 Tax=Pedobacter sp. MC2016-14 TaxID=2897327 RepID=UPI001E4FD735|nr:COX15/CtaA family protein [Pedobacter sp. MC2016-14]MCD0487688.1 COX15/CtaA family protein [Pedobacter sp. MC2016-14]